MTARLSILTLALLTTAVAVAAPKEVKPAGAGFSARMPGQPKHEKQPGQVEVHTYLVQDKGLLYLVGYGNYPAATVNASTPKKVLEADRDSFVKSTSGRITRQKPITMGSYPGIEFDVETGKGAEMRIREYLVGTRLYQVVFGGPKGSLVKPEGKAFLDSFKLVK